MQEQVIDAHEHDLLHSHGEDPWAFESYWFSFFVPERRLMVYVYPWFRPTTGVAGGGVLAWDHRAAEPWNIVHCDYQWHMPFDPAAIRAQGAVLALPQGVKIAVLKPLRDFAIEYAHARLSLKIEFRAIHPANVATAPIGSSQLFAGRIDQCGRVTGELVLDGERITIDCLSMRDRSWGLRRDDNLDMNIGYFHATASDGDAFLVVSNHADPGAGPEPLDEAAPVVAGYLMQAGELHTLERGTVRLLRDAHGVPQACEIAAVDRKGRRLDAGGEALNHFAYQPFPGMFNWSSLARWQFNSITCIGELQNTWHPDRWRVFARSRMLP